MHRYRTISRAIETALAGLLQKARSLARRFLLVTIIAIGAMCGGLAVLFHRLAEGSRSILIGRALAQPEPWRSVLVVLTLGRQVRTCIEPPALVAVASETVVELVRRMQRSGVDRSPVIDGAQSGQVVGFVSPADLLRVRMRETAAEGESPFEIFG